MSAFHVPHDATTELELRRGQGLAEDFHILTPCTGGQSVCEATPRSLV